MRIRHAFVAVGLAAASVLVSAAAANAAASRAGGGFDSLFLDGRVVRTLAVPVVFPGQGRDPIYTFPSGVEGQLSVTAVGPGTGDYHGGAWQLYTVTWADGAVPYLITSDEEVAAAAAAGDVTVTRNAAADFRCPVLP